MSSFGGRRVPNVSEYIANLNTVPQAFDMPAPHHDGLDFEEDLALFTNAEFFDFDIDELPNMPDGLEYDAAQERRARRENASATFRHAVPGKPDSAALNGDFPHFPDFSNFTNIVAADPASAVTPTFPTQPTNVFPTNAAYASASSSPISPRSGSVSQPAKRKLDSLSDSVSHQQVAGDEGARVAAEEDKRRRNTAASARFRVKKKQREQALERTAKEMGDKVSVLESRVSQLEMENKWLKSLITEKNESKGDFSEIYKRLTKDGGASEAARSSGGRTDGVGTVKEETANKA